MGRFTAILRYVHLVSSMLAAVLILLFAVTGLLLNNAKELELDQGAVATVQAAVPVALLKHPDPDALTAALGRTCPLPGALGAFEIEDDSVRLVFRAPGCVTEVRIQRADGRAEIETESRGTSGALMDLHRGKNAGPGWRALIDTTALLLGLSVVTGIALGFALPKRRLLTLLLLLASAAAAGAAYHLLVR
jgi:uncharacterized protein